MGGLGSVHTLSVVKVHHRSALAFDVPGRWRRHAACLGHEHDTTTGLLGDCRGAVRRCLHVHTPHGPTRVGGGAGGARGSRRVRWLLRRDRLSRDSSAGRRHSRARRHQLDAGGTGRALSPDAVYVPRRANRPGCRSRGSRLCGHAARARALEGAVIGAALGALAGALFGASQGSNPAPVPMCTNLDGGMICTTIGGHGLLAGEKAALTGVGLGVTTAGVGALIGMLVGHTD